MKTIYGSVLEAKQGFIPRAEEPVTTEFHSHNTDFFSETVLSLLLNRNQDASKTNSSPVHANEWPKTV